MALKSWTQIAEPCKINKQFVKLSKITNYVRHVTCTIHEKENAGRVDGVVTRVIIIMQYY